MNVRQYGILALTLRYWFMALILYVFWHVLLGSIRSIKSEGRTSRSTGNVPFVLALFTVSAFGLLSFSGDDGFSMETALLGILAAAIIFFQFYLFYYVFKGMDEILLMIIDTLAVFGFVMLQRLTPELALRQIEWFAAGNIIQFLVIIAVSRIKDLSKLVYPMMAAGVSILFIVLVLGEEQGGATNWLPIGPLSIQPSEFVKIIFIAVFSYYLKERKSFRQSMPLFIFTALCILAVVLQKDLGSALHYILLFLFLYHIGTNRWLVTGAAMAAGTVASIISYHVFSHVRVRVEAWKNPWADVGGRGYQVAQSLMAIASGGLLGFGLGLGEPYIIPASRTDFIFAAICEEFGVIVGGIIIGLYVLIIIRGLSKSLQADNVPDVMLSCGATISLGIQAFIIIGGVIKLIPLTGVTLPFISYGGSSMVVSLTLTGIIHGISIKNLRNRCEDPDAADDGAGDEDKGDDHK